MIDDGRPEQVKVFCRIKPSFDTDEKCIAVIDEQSLSVQNQRHTGSKSIHTFSHVFPSLSTQNDVYAKCLSPYVNSVLSGDSALFFAYGVTGSGKTHTMLGALEDPGLIPRTLDTLFNSIASYLTLKYVVKPNGYNSFCIQSEAEAIMDRQRLEYTTKPRTPYRANSISPDLKDRYIEPTMFPVSQKCLYSVFISFAELYSDNIYDLLDPNGGSGKTSLRTLNLCEDVKHNTYVNGITEIEVTSAEEAINAYYQGQKNRRVGSTALNKDSSRSHGIFNIRIVRTGYDSNYDEVIPDAGLMNVSQLCLVDLAGSERTNRSGTTGDRLKEAAKINNSLMTLRKCLEILRSNQTSRCIGGQSVQQIVPYRDSKLTRLFKPFFDGHGQVGILVCVDPICEEYAETAQVLQFAERSQQISTNVPPTPVHSSAIGSAKHSRSSSSTLVLMSEDLASAITQTECLDTSLKTSISSILKTDADAVSYCGCSFNSIRPSSNSKRSKRSSLGKRKHDDNCLLLSVLRARANLRKRVRSLVTQMSSELKDGVVGLLKRVEEGEANMTLLDSMDVLKSEKSNVQTKLRRLEDEVNQQRRLVRHERAERTREADVARGQLKKLRGQVISGRGVGVFATPNTPRTLPRRTRGAVKTSSGSSKSSCSSGSSIVGDVGANGSRTDTKTPFVSVASSRVATLSRQWESILAAKQEQAMRSRRPPLTATTPLNRPPPMNPRHQHLAAPTLGTRRNQRRSKSVGGGGDVPASVWLEHKENHAVPLGTIFSPSRAHIKKSATQIDLNDTLKATNYVLHHQTATPDGNVETQLYKGSIIPTAGGGSAVIFNDVEHLRQTSPINTGVRRSARLTAKHSCPPSDDDTDGGLEGLTPLDPPPSAKRRATSRSPHRHRRDSTTSGFSSGAPFGGSDAKDLGTESGDTTTSDRRSMASYRTISPPRRYIGITSSGGVSGGGGKR